MASIFADRALRGKGTCNRSKIPSVLRLQNCRIRLRCSSLVSTVLGHTLAFRDPRNETERTEIR
jgi:hypothetical protein